MRKLSSVLIVLLVVSVFITSFAGAVKAQTEDSTFYYFTTIEGLINAPECWTEDPFCNQGLVGLSINAPSSLAMTLNTLEEIEISLSGVGSDIAVLSFSSGTPSIIADNNINDTTNSGDSRNISIASTNDLGVSEIIVTAVAGSDTVTETILVSVEDSFLCNAADPLAGLMCEDGACDGGSDDIYLIGGITGNASNAKKQLICITENQGEGGAASGNPMAVSYKMTSNVVFTSNDWSGAFVNGWIPIGDGDSGISFQGSFDGDGYSVSNMFIGGSRGFAGFFGVTSSPNSEIKNLGMKNVNVSSDSGGAQIGGLVSLVAAGGPVTNCYATGTVISTGLSSRAGVLAGGLQSVSGGLNDLYDRLYSSGSVTTSGNGSVAGGLIGGASATLTNSYSSAIVTANGDGVYAGGLVGMSNNITNCYAVGNINSSGFEAMAGGLVAQSNSAGPPTGISNSYATGSVTISGNNNMVGGLIGMSGVSIENSYSTGDIVNWGVSNSIEDPRDIYAGGLLGWCSQPVSNSYATGNISGILSGGTVGGLIGISFGEITSSYAGGSINVTGDHIYAGGLIGGDYNGIEDSYSTGNISMSGTLGTAGGLTARSFFNINDSYATGSVISNGYQVGGLVGSAYDGNINNSYSSGSVVGATDVGGLIGSANGITINNCYSNADVTSNGISENSTIPDYNNRESSLAGGLIGRGDLTINTSFSSGNVISNGVPDNVYAAGLIGSVSGDVTTINNSYTIGASSGSGTNKILYAEEYDGGSVIVHNDACTSNVESCSQEDINILQAGDTFGAWSPAVWRNLNDSNLGLIFDASTWDSSGANPVLLTPADPTSLWDEDIWNLSGSEPILKDMPAQ